MRDPVLYRNLLTEILRGKLELFGEVALRRARGVSGLRVGDDGRVLHVDGDGLATLLEVLLVFERLSGRASTISARTVVRRMGLADRHPDLELPPSLR